MNRIKEIFARVVTGLGRAAKSDDPFTFVLVVLFTFCAGAAFIVAFVLLSIATYGIAPSVFVVVMAYYYYRTGEK
jgi:hypothetical protein